MCLRATFLELFGQLTSLVSGAKLLYGKAFLLQLSRFTFLSFLFLLNERFFLKGTLLRDCSEQITSEKVNQPKR